MASQKSDFDSRAIAALKLQWRRQLKQIRRDLDPSRRKYASKMACEWLIQKTSEFDHILSFASFGSEIDLWQYNHHLIEKKRLILPRLVNKHIQLFRIKQISELERHSLGHLEPGIHKERIDASTIQVALIPALGFDLKTKYRLGYGQGHYDTFLKNQPELMTWGIGFLEQSVENLPFDRHDVRLKKIFLF